MLPIHVALVCENGDVSAAELCGVAAALQKQAIRDLAPCWAVQATVNAFLSLDGVPPGYWPVIVVGGVSGPGVMGTHLDRYGQPFALVPPSPSWTLAASHQMLDMLIDPSGNRLVTGRSPKPGQGRVAFLVEGCDPCEDPGFAYTVDGVMVSDFITPHFEGPVAASGVRFSFTGAVSRPHQVLKGGSLTWLDPVSRKVWQETLYGDQPEHRSLGCFDPGRGSLREWVDARTDVLMADGGSGDDGEVPRAAGRPGRADRSTGSMAEELRVRIRELTGPAP